MDQVTPEPVYNPIAQNRLYRTDDSTAPRIIKERRSAKQPDRALGLKLIQGDRQMLYAMRVKDGIIKIGCTSNLSRRRDALVGDILGFTFGDFDDEAAIHDSLAAHVHHGREWYNPTPEVLAVVNDMRAEFNLDPIAA